ncbi:hypothetical protein FVEG_15347 [Fusarium verticillioides 7600]|uniref:Uncharacterized protein n=1 Tax=Gibberella moniliformis (strain M3125 / FGSC 7600) TaxID=334819 RepID=W7MA88_GIBM7|nr:hypothetical protein FVEG_15347 [Fusarium verticillioides 7600]EWG41837.1 hypothetical protein FVEG_15347 [Fusarium verticillioides 7600]
MLISQFVLNSIQRSASRLSLPVSLMACTWAIPHLTRVGALALSGSCSLLYRVVDVCFGNVQHDSEHAQRRTYSQRSASSNQSLHLASLKMQTKLDDFDVCVVTEKMVSDRWF